ncbi:MAG: hypothetical protein C0624_06270 [Desulfuromonas sp.]|nr:MAG: hypothetical protein C0624_06270 [Desulfuromonas sp.]
MNRPRIDHKPGEPPYISVQQWEACCKQCGLCCFEKIIDQRGHPQLTREACRYLDIVERTCRVYHKRFETGEVCLKLTPEVVREADWLPEECAYLLLLKEYPDLQLET